MKDSVIRLSILSVSQSVSLSRPLTFPRPSDSSLISHCHPRASYVKIFVTSQRESKEMREGVMKEQRQGHMTHRAPPAE